MGVTIFDRREEGGGGGSTFCTFLCFLTLSSQSRCSLVFVCVCACVCGGVLVAVSAWPMRLPAERHQVHRQIYVDNFSRG